MEINLSWLAWDCSPSKMFDCNIEIAPPKADDLELLDEFEGRFRMHIAVFPLKMTEIMEIRDGFVNKALNSNGKKGF